MLSVLRPKQEFLSGDLNIYLFPVSDDQTPKLAGHTRPWPYDDGILYDGVSDTVLGRKSSLCQGLVRSLEHRLNNRLPPPLSLSGP